MDISSEGMLRIPIVLNDNPLMMAIFSCTLDQTVTFTLIPNFDWFNQKETDETEVIMFYKPFTD